VDGLADCAGAAEEDVADGFFGWDAAWDELCKGNERGRACAA